MTAVSAPADLAALSDQELESLAERVRDARAARQSAVAASGPIPWRLFIDAGNSRAGAKGWAKRVTGIDPAPGNGHGIHGDWLNSDRDRKGAPSGDYQGAQPEGALFRPFSELSRDERIAMTNEEWNAVPPEQKRSCHDCHHLKALVSLWCGNQEAVKARGTAIPGGCLCPYWEPITASMPWWKRLMNYWLNVELCDAAAPQTVENPKPRTRQRSQQ